MKFKKEIKVFGDKSYRGDCPSEFADHVSFVTWIEYHHPEYRAVMVHAQNEGKKTHQQVTRSRKQGMTTGTSDIVIPARIPFICEIKRRDHMQSHWQKGQEDYLINTQNLGAFSCVALGLDGCKEAFNAWLNTSPI